MKIAEESKGRAIRTNRHNCVCQQALHFQDQTFSFELLRTASYALYGGAEIGECLATANRIHDGDFESWYAEWRHTAEHVQALATRSLVAGHTISARDALLRCSNYFRTAEFFMASDDPRRLPTYEKSRATFRQALELTGVDVELVRFPYEGTTLPGYFYRVDGSDMARPTLLALGGFDSTGEELYFLAAVAALRHGYNCLAFDGPGQGEPLRFQHLPARPDYEAPVCAAVDYLMTRPEVDPGRLALMGSSMGGYYASRAAAFEPRIKALIVHGVVYDLWEMQTKTKPALAKLGNWKSPQRVERALRLAERFNTELRWSVTNGQWVFGAPNRFELLQTLHRYSLKDVAGLIRCPTLILHGERDHFVPGEQVDNLYAALNSPKTLRVFSAYEGAEEHCQMGNMSLLHQVIFDWLDEVMLRDNIRSFS